jgi:hypothetical protein
MSDFELPSGAATTKPKVRAGMKPTPEVETPKVEVPEEKKVESEDKLKWDPNTLLAIFDEIIFSGVYSENIIIRNKLQIKFRTRTADEIEAITDSLDATSANLISTMNEKRMVLNLYFALTYYQGKDLSVLSREDKERFIGKLPAPVVGALISALTKFDEKVYAACKEGEENF